MLARSNHGERFAIQRAAGGHRNAEPPGQVLTGERVRVGRHLGGHTAGHQEAALASGAGAKVHDVVGAANGFFIVLDDQHGVAQIPQPLQGPQQAVVVAMVQADRGLIQHVEHSAQPRADLGGQADALPFAA